MTDGSSCGRCRTPYSGGLRIRGAPLHYRFMEPRLMDPLLVGKDLCVQGLRPTNQLTPDMATKNTQRMEDASSEITWYPVKKRSRNLEMPISGRSPAITCLSMWAAIDRSTEWVGTFLTRSAPSSSKPTRCRSTAKLVNLNLHKHTGQEWRQKTFGWANGLWQGIFELQVPQATGRQGHWNEKIPAWRVQSQVHYLEVPGSTTKSYGTAARRFGRRPVRGALPETWVRDGVTTSLRVLLTDQAAVGGQYVRALPAHGPLPIFRRASRLRQSVLRALGEDKISDSRHRGPQEIGRTSTLCRQRKSTSRCTLFLSTELPRINTLDLEGCPGIQTWALSLTTTYSMEVAVDIRTTSSFQCTSAVLACRRDTVSAAS